MTNPSPLPGKFSAWTELLGAVESNNGVYQVSMETLRQLEGAQRLGPNVLGAIKGRLSTLGFGHLPTELPSRGGDRVILYRVGTPASDTIDAIQNGLSSAGDSTYTALQQLNAAPTAAEVVEVDELREKAAGAASAVLALLSGSEAETARRAVENLLPEVERNVGHPAAS